VLCIKVLSRDLSEGLKKTMKIIAQAEIPNECVINTDHKFKIPASISCSVQVILLETLLVRWPCHSLGGYSPASYLCDRFRSQLRSSDICGGQSGTGAGTLRVFRLPLPILIPPNVPYSPIIRVWYNGLISGRCTKFTQSHPTPIKLKKVVNWLRI
jgi:hypothetical protein